MEDVTHRLWKKAHFLHNEKSCYSCDRPLLSLTWDGEKWELLEWGARTKTGYRIVGRFNTDSEAKRASVR